MAPSSPDAPSSQTQSSSRTDRRTRPRDPRPFLDDADLPAVSTRRPPKMPRPQNDGRS